MRLLTEQRGQVMARRRPVVVQRVRYRPIRATALVVEDAVNGIRLGVFGRDRGKAVLSLLKDVEGEPGLEGQVPHQIDAGERIADAAVGQRLIEPMGKRVLERVRVIPATREFS